MRKLFPMLLFSLLLALLMAVPALAADFTYDDFSATLTVPDSYTMLTASNLADHEDLLAKQGLTVETAQADWAARGVRFQAWNAAGDMCIELSAVQDDFAMQYWDVNEVTSDERATYRLGHTSDKNGYYRNLGYDYTSAQWKNGKNYARFLVLEYTRSHNGVSYAGYGRKSHPQRLLHLSGVPSLRSQPEEGGQQRPAGHSGHAEVQRNLPASVQCRAARHV